MLSFQCLDLLQAAIEDPIKTPLASISCNLQAASSLLASNHVSEALGSLSFEASLLELPSTAKVSASGCKLLE